MSPASWAPTLRGRRDAYQRVMRADLWRPASRAGLAAEWYIESRRAQ
ncbi:hypothetical protein HMPREF1868_00146 [Olsenella sp. DNF00959]|nr:hypothetical protein HMPREF1868_00146 [Olsenella sp. DNF00959]